MAAMPLRLTYLNRSRLWADLLSVEGDRVFVATAEPLKVGDSVSIAIDAPELLVPISVNAVVQGQRPVTGTLPGGVFVRVDAPSLERCKAAIGEGTDAPVRTTGRKELRADCTLTLRFVTPEPSQPCEVKSLSATGFTIKGAVPLTHLMKVTVVLKLADGSEVPVGAQVIWVRPELQLAGFKITAVEPKDQQRIAETVKGLATTGQAATGVTIVVADDDPSILDFAFLAISKLGHRVLRAERGDAALALIRQERPRLVLLDVLMPGLDGLEVCKAIRADEQLNRIPVVLLSAMGESRLKEAARQAGASDFLTKPMHLESLRMLITKFVG
jgi:CheY-like chemotaxis protein